MILSGFLAILRYDSFQVGAFNDDAHYLVLAESLAHGQGYHLVNFPNSPVESAFPPGWPLLLTPFVYLFGDNLTFLKLLPYCLWLLTIPLIYRYFSRRLTAPYNQMMISLVALSPVLIGTSTMLMSESAYLFFSFVTLNLFDGWNQLTYHKANRWLIVLVGAGAVYTELIRTVGLALVVAILFCLVVSRRLRPASIFTAVTVIGFFPQVWLNVQSRGGIVSSGYEAEVFGVPASQRFGQVLANLQAYESGLISTTLFPPLSRVGISHLGAHALVPALNFLVVLVITFGYVGSLRKIDVSDVYVALYFGALLMFWNPISGSAQARYIIPVMPFLYAYLLRGFASFAQWIARPAGKWGGVIIIAGVAAIALSFIALDLADWRNPVRNRLTDLSIGTTWIARNTPPTSIIMTPDPVPDYLYARRRTVGYPTVANEILDSVQRAQVGYVLIAPKLQAPRTTSLEPFVSTDLLPFIISRPDEFRIVFRDPTNNVTVYRVRLSK